MSKIYEALLRAEIERLTTKDEVSQATTVPLPVRERDYAELSAGPGWPDVDVVASSVLNGLPSDPAKIAVKRWKPLLHQLPALGERGASVEQFRTLRSRVQEFRDLGVLKTVLVSSGLPGEGKSFVSANLAISLARRKQNRVLLIDGDMRRSSLHKLLGAPCEPGLTDYLSGNASMFDVMQRAHASDGMPSALSSLTFIAGGGDADNAADLSSNNRFKELIVKASAFFDWIIVDSSPVNVIADGVNLAHACDGVLLVARGGVTKFETAQRALSQLKASNVLGIVLNAVSDPPVSGGYYGYDAPGKQTT
ncbi:capsular exopolysaccharide family [Granulicella pectinivorans]|uniref:Capsular exopolysaccharide family n=1 Tax=Granulicella pectinivorans TaxID=474950 RepID=A0A1I6MMC5_9BACT|nr:CpsD/CapB family tyrosine-protein kinase [Granulicella pectinivorans]SFS16829.1 capsular exopolysaccharide family [Granulicella pectinivorans]